MITAHDLSKRYGPVVAVDRLAFSIPAGEIVGFLGPNGAGKTTTLRMITGALRPSSGSVNVCGHDMISDSLEARRRIGYLPESTPLYTEMRVMDYVMFRAKLSGVGRRLRREAVDRAMERCKLTTVRRRPIHQLSKGFRQRVGMAGALVHEPPVLVLDEPTVGLDPSQIQEVRSLIQGLAGTHTVVLSTHILPEVEAMCQRVMLIAGGRLRVQGSLDDLRKSAIGRPWYAVEADRDETLSIQRIAGVARVRIESLPQGWIRHTIDVLPEAMSEDLREALARALSASGAVVRELHRESESLESFFLRTVAEEGRT